MSLLRWGLTALTVVSLAACSTAQLRAEPPAQPAVVGAPAHDNLNATLDPVRRRIRRQRA